jgi:hypothetical protein
MAALNRTRIDYLSLDIEGAELDVLKTIPWDRLDIRILSVEYAHGPLGKQGYEDFMKSKGYEVFADIHVRQSGVGVRLYLYQERMKSVNKEKLNFRALNRKMSYHFPNRSCAV